jgi:hypothetical protein
MQQAGQVIGRLGRQESREQPARPHGADLGQLGETGGVDVGRPADSGFGERGREIATESGPQAGRAEGREDRIDGRVGARLGGQAQNTFSG